MALSALFIWALQQGTWRLPPIGQKQFGQKKNQIPHLLMQLCPIRNRFSIKKNSSNRHQQKQPSFIFPPFHFFSITYS